MKILSFPEFRQTYEYDCGAKALQAVLEYYGIDVSEGKIINLAKTTKKGTSPKSVVNVIKRYKLKFKEGQLTISQIKKYLDKRIPVIILLQAWTEKKKFDWEKDWTDGHYVVAVGYGKNKVYFEDPYSVLRTYLTYKELNKRWHDKEDRKEYVHYGIAVYGKKPKFNPNKKIHMG
jgi:ABC-type bacteriocin/lantibiotic exporter with double-glycine peptidase domain